VLSLGCRTIGLWCLPLALVGSCSVFPDEATLPTQLPNGGAGGGEVTTHAGTGGHLDAASGAGSGSGAAAGVGEGGAPAAAGAPGQAGAGGEVVVVGGAGAGAGGTAPCLHPEQQVVAVTDDTWIDAAKPSAGHGNDIMLSVVGGTAERRALLQLTLPAVPAGKVLNQASFVLHLEANADVSLAGRRLGLYRLDQAVNESRTTWTNYANGANKQWLLPGGDFGPELSAAAVRAGVASGPLTFKVTEPVKQVMGATAITLSVIVLEKGSPPVAPAELAFTSSEGDASSIPALILDFCDQ
jgi:hypothetical protein